MTPRQLELLNFIKGYDAEHGYAPTYREMAKALGVTSPSGAYAHSQALIASGHLKPARKTRNGRAFHRDVEVIKPTAKVIVRVRGHEYLSTVKTGDVEVVVEDIGNDA